MCQYKTRPRLPSNGGHSKEKGQGLHCPTLFSGQPTDRRVVQSEMVTDLFEREVPGLVRGADGSVAVAVAGVGGDPGQTLRPALPLGHFGCRLPGPGDGLFDEGFIAEKYLIGHLFGRIVGVHALSNKP